MKVIRAKTAGFCMGVALALQKLDSAIEAHKGQRICTMGPIIHNPQVLEHYASLGVVCLQNINNAQADDCIIVRAHGIPKNKEMELEAKGVSLIDATCPKVKKAQVSIAKATQEGSVLLLFGEEDHPEVRGLVSYAAYDAIVFTSLQELQQWELKPDLSYVLASQTTQDGKKFIEITQYLQNVFPNMPVLSTICNATHERQNEILHIASKVDAVIVVGGKSSGNTCRLADVSASKAVPTWHIERVTELENIDFSKFSSIGLTAGASTPKHLIDNVCSFLEAQ